MDNPTPRLFGTFVSHSSKDDKAARELCSLLESGRSDSDSVRCWIAPRNLVFGKPYPLQIRDGIERSATMVLLVSRHSATSHEVLAELQCALEFGKTIFPVYLDDSPAAGLLQPHIGQLHAMRDLTTPISVRAIALRQHIWTSIEASIEVGPIEPGPGETDPDAGRPFGSGFLLLQKRIPPEELDAFDDISKWIVRTNQQPEAYGFRDYFVGAKLRLSPRVEQVFAVLNYTHYWRRRPPLLFISYVVVDRGPRSRRIMLVERLFRYLRQTLRTELPDCAAVVAELDDPDLPELKPKPQRHARARLETFRRHAVMSGFRFDELDWLKYRQPALNPEAGGSEVRMRLVYVHDPRVHAAGPVRDREWARELLTFIYERIYGDSFPDRPAAAEATYRSYLRDLVDRVLAESGFEPTSTAVG